MDGNMYNDAPPPYNPQGYAPAGAPAAPGFSQYPAGYQPPPVPYPAGYQAQPAQAYQPKGQVYSAAPVRTVTTSSVVVQPVPVQQNVVVVRGGGNCPRCATGYMVEDFSCCGIFLAIFFFPLGLICCLLMRHRYCNTCGYSM